MTNVGRPRSFDVDTVLAKAMQTFWRGGYEGTTYTDLERSTGLRRQSLTYVFGEKASLFRHALKLYVNSRVKIAAQLLERDLPVRENIRAVFDAWEKDAKSGEGRGCLLVRATAELSDKPDMACVLREGDNCLMASFTTAFEAAQNSGELHVDIPADALARLAISAGNGAMVQAVARQDVSVSRTAHNAFLSLLK